MIIGSQPVSKAGVPQGIAGSSPACSAIHVAVAISRIERGKTDAGRNQGFQRHRKAETPRTGGIPVR